MPRCYRCCPKPQLFAVTCRQERPVVDQLIGWHVSCCTVHGARCAAILRIQLLLVKQTNGIVRCALCSVRCALCTGLQCWIGDSVISSPTTDAIIVSKLSLKIKSKKPLRFAYMVSRERQKGMMSDSITCNAHRSVNSSAQRRRTNVNTSLQASRFQMRGGGCLSGIALDRESARVHLIRTLRCNLRQPVVE